MCTKHQANHAMNKNFFLLRRPTVGFRHAVDIPVRLRQRRSGRLDLGHVYRSPRGPLDLLKCIEGCTQSVCDSFQHSADTVI